MTFRANAFLVLLVCMTTSLLANEYVIVSGGCALRYFEKSKAASHDKYWGNFIDAAITQANTVIKPSLKEGERITWLVYSPSYEARSTEEGRDLLAVIRDAAEKNGLSLMWFKTRDEFVNYLNHDRKDANKIIRLDYFGHSNKRCWMFDYSNHLDGGSVETGTFHMKNFSKVQRDIFADNAIAQSWGCHSGEEYSGAWYKRTGIRMIGAIGKTDYSKGGLPFLSSEGGRWAQ